MLSYVCLFLFITTSFSQGGFERDWGFVGAGARATSMGGAFTSIADDATAIAWNPAGLTNLTSAEIGLVTRFNLGVFKSDFNASQIEFFQTKSISSLQVNFASVIVPLNDQFVFGLAYRPINDWEKRIEDEITFNGSDFMQVYEHIGGVNAITISAAFKPIDMLSIGANLNLLITEYSLNYTFGPAIGAPSATFTDNEGYGTTQTIDVGFLFKPVETLSIGAMLNLGYALDINFNGTDILGGSYNFDGTADVPLFYTVGASFKATDVLTLAFDYRNQSWSKTGLSDLDLRTIHIGVEYLNIGDESVSAIRFGYFNKQYLEEDANGAQIENPVITLGFGKALERFSLDFSLQTEFINFEEHYSDFLGNRTQTGANFGLSASFVFYLGN